MFGFVSENLSKQAERYRKLKLCPYNNKVPNCTKDKANDPLGVCCIYYEEGAVITCPVRFHQNWIIAENAADFFFDKGTSWTSLAEVRLKDKYGQSAGNIDIVIVAYDEKGKISDFGSLEIQAVYISGNIRKPFQFYMEDRNLRKDMDWSSLADYYPRPDFLSSSRKRLVPQLLYKGGILKKWGKKQAVAIQGRFYDTLPELPEVSSEEAEIAWFLYDLKPEADRFELTLDKTVFTKFWPALNIITTPEAGDIDEFADVLQNKLDEKRDNASPDAPLLTDIFLQ